MSKKTVYPLEGTVPDETIAGILECCEGHSPESFFDKRYQAHVFMCPWCGFIAGGCNDTIMAISNWNRCIALRTPNAFLPDYLNKKEGQA